MIDLNIFKTFERKKQELIAEEQAMRERIRTEEEASRKRLQEEERASRARIQSEERMSRERIKMEEASLLRRQNELKKQIQQFENEQRLRESIENKTDRDIVVEMHVKAMRIFNILSDIDSKLVGVQDYSNHLGNIADRITQLASEIEGSLGSSIEELRSSNLSREDITNAVSDALNYDSYSFSSDLESSIENAVGSIIESKMSDIESRLSSIELSLDNH